MIRKRNRSIETIFAAGLVAAALDIIAAMLVYAVILDITTSQKVLQAVASGVLGRSAFEGGWPTALIGLALHTFIALCFAAFFYLIYPYLNKMIPNKWVAGIVYGCFVWAVMNLVVLRIVTGRPFTFDLDGFLYGIGLIICMVGIPISLITARMRSHY